jgi:nucleotide-binding universal stress UspA family protein
VVGLDGSAGSARALDWAVGLAAGVDAEVIAVHALELPQNLPRPGGVPYVPDLETWERATRQDFELVWCRPLTASGVRHRKIFEVGRAGDVTLRLADELAADLIVTGRRGRSELAELLAGSVSQRLVHRAHCPVVVVPAVPAVESLDD